MWWKLLMDGTSALMIEKVLEKSLEKLNRPLNKCQRRREKIKFTKIFYSKILKKYGNYPYYDDLSKFILKNNIIEAFFDNHSSSVDKIKGHQSLIFYYIEVYKKQNKNSSEYIRSIKQFLYDLYNEIIEFNLKSDYISTEQKIISNVNINAQNILDKQETLEKNLKDEIISSKKSIIETNQIEENNYFIDEDKFNKYKNKLLEEYYSEDYLSRKVESFDGTLTDKDSYQLLNEKKKIIITGEAGIGKSTEAHYLLKQFIDDIKFQNYIPIYLNLAHYGVLYYSLKEGINQKLDGFIKPTETTTDRILTEEKFFIIFDGLDEINDYNKIDKTIAEFNDLSFKFNDNYYLLTIRENEINNRLSEDIVFRIQPLKYSQMITMLEDNSISKSIYENDTQLLKNPLFLRLAIKLNNKNNQMVNLNKSDLVEAIILHLLTDNNSNISTSNTLDLLADFSYYFFTQNSFKVLDFDEYFESMTVDSKNSRFIINNLIQSNIFKINEFTIEFTYKTFKDYFCSRYLLNRYKEKGNLTFINDYVDNSKWEESLIYLVGLIGNLDKQTELLDIYMYSNLPLYIRSIESKNNLYDKLSELSLKSFLKKLGTDFIVTYEYLLNNYFSEIVPLIYPFSSLSKKKSFDEYHLNLVMYITEDRKNVSYFLRLVPVTVGKLQIITDLNEFNKISDEFHDDYITQNRKKVHRKNLNYNGLAGDSGRLLAIKNLKSELNELIENYGLYNSSYLYFENLRNKLNKVDFLKHLDNIDEIINKLDNYLSRFSDDLDRLNILDTAVILGNENIDMVKLYKSLLPFRDSNIKLSDYKFIESDVDWSKTSGYIWSLYSLDKRKEIIIEFFEVGNSSVYQMFNYNFPKLTEYLMNASSIPYRTDVYIEKKFSLEEDTQLTYVDIPVENEDQITTKIIQVDKKQRNFEFIQEKYNDYSLDKKPINFSSTAFSHIFLSGKSHNNIPITDYVYEEVRTRLESQLGKLK